MSNTTNWKVYSKKAEVNNAINMDIANIREILIALFSMLQNILRIWTKLRESYVIILLYLAEFINPKYADETKTKFKSSARLECLMQDYPKLL